MRPHCWDAICYAAGTTRNGGSVTLSQSDCRELTAYVIQLTARGVADQPAPTEPRCPNCRATFTEERMVEVGMRCPACGTRFFRKPEAEPAPTPQCDGSCGSLFCGAIYGSR